MERLSRHDLSAFVAWTKEIDQIQEAERFQMQTLLAIKKIVHCDFSIFNIFTTQWRPVSFVTDSMEHFAQFSQHWEDLHLLVRDHPILLNRHLIPQADVYKISDFAHRREYRRSVIYNEVYQKVEIEFQIAFELPGHNSDITTYVFNRRHRDFSERDRTLLTLIRAHLSQAHRSFLNRKRLQQFKALVQSESDIRKEGIIVVNREGQIELCSPKAIECLTKYFGRHASTSEKLPPALRVWVERHRAEAAVSAIAGEEEGQRLMVQLIQNRDKDGFMLILSETPSSTRLQLDGRLTPREGEVLLWLARGKTNADIGLILGASPRTVQKHLEHIYTKLGVETRTAAAAWAHSQVNIA